MSFIMIYYVIKIGLFRLVSSEVVDMSILPCIHERENKLEAQVRRVILSKGTLENRQETDSRMV